MCLALVKKLYRSFYIYICRMHFFIINIVARIPTLKIIPERLTVQEGDSAKFVCNVKSLRPTQIVWSRYSGESLSKQATVEGNVLRFNSVKKSDDGTYVCTASNDVALRTAKAVLVVRGKYSSRMLYYYCVLTVYM